MVTIFGAIGIICGAISHDFDPSDAISLLKGFKLEMVVCSLCDSSVKFPFSAGGVLRFLLAAAALVRFLEVTEEEHFDRRAFDAEAVEEEDKQDEVAEEDPGEDMVVDEDTGKVETFEVGPADGGAIPGAAVEGEALEVAVWLVLDCSFCMILL